MGHLVGKDLYRRLGEKLDGLSTRAPWTEALHAILSELYSAEDAELVVKMGDPLHALDPREAVRRRSCARSSAGSCGSRR